ncbi:MAG TPA: hypothetical protein VES02_10115, partial [Dermatophilaceae bacterium]|nr:hypothetical protein [Dermatophilaceae bacterium]
MTRVRMSAVAVCLGLGLVLTVGGCGVSVQQEAQSLPSGALPTLAPTPNPSPTAKEDTVYFVSGRGLVGVREPVD